MLTRPNYRKKAVSMIAVKVRPSLRAFLKQLSEVPAVSTEQVKTNKQQER